MGVDLSARYETREVALSPGDALVLYSDGITEAFDGSGKPFGEVRLLDVAPTLLDLVGVEAPASWSGRPSAAG